MVPAGGETCGLEVGVGGSLLVEGLIEGMIMGRGDYYICVVCLYERKSGCEEGYKAQVKAERLTPLSLSVKRGEIKREV